MLASRNTRTGRQPVGWSRRNCAERELRLPRVELADSFVAVQLDRHWNGRPEQEAVGRGFSDEQIVRPEAEGAPQLGREG